jgi:signal transduction histidine kinase
MPDGGRIMVNAERRGGEAVIEVSDTGKGIPPEIGDRLFKPFVTTKTGGLAWPHPLQEGGRGTRRDDLRIHAPRQGRGLHDQVTPS